MRAHTNTRHLPFSVTKESVSHAIFKPSSLRSYSDQFFPFFFFSENILSLKWGVYAGGKERFQPSLKKNVCPFCSALSVGWWGPVGGGLTFCLCVSRASPPSAFPSDAATLPQPVQGWICWNEGSCLCLFCCCPLLSREVAGQLQGPGSHHRARQLLG